MYMRRQVPHHTSIIVTSSFFLLFQQPSHTLGDKDFVGLQQWGYKGPFDSPTYICFLA